MKASKLQEAWTAGHYEGQRAVALALKARGDHPEFGMNLRIPHKREVRLAWLAGFSLGFNRAIVPHLKGEESAMITALAMVPELEAR